MTALYTEAIYRHRSGFAAAVGQTKPVFSMPGMITIAVFSTRFDADLAVARLAYAGYESAVLADPAHSIAPHHVTARGFQLLVRDEVGDSARSVLGTDSPPDHEADALDAMMFRRPFADRPSWIRFSTWTVLIAVAGPIAVAALIMVISLVSAAFP